MKQVQPGTKQEKPRTKKGRLGIQQGQQGTKQGQPGIKQGQGHNWTNAGESTGNRAAYSISEKDFLKGQQLF